MRHLTSLRRSPPDKAADENFVPLIKVVVHFLLLTLVDTGATDDFVSKGTIEEFKLLCAPFPTHTPVAVGTDDATAEALGSTDALMIQLGVLCKHRTNFTVLPLADYDIVDTILIIKGDDCFITSQRGLQALPGKVDIST